VLRHDGAYYYCESTASGVHIRTTQTLAGLGASERRRVWRPPARGPVSANLWAPELHWIDGRGYIYFAADDGQNEHHRMWVLGARTSDLAGDYEFLGGLETEGWAIDGTPFCDAAGAHYFVWSGWPGAQDGQQNLYIARMKNPVTLDGPRALLATPTESWERRGLPLCEGPQILQRAGRTFLIYSASGSWTADYCLGLMEHLGGDPLEPGNWRKHGCVFRRNRHAWGVGHCGFTTTADGRDWLLYHAKTSVRPGWADREVRAQPFHWREDGLPEFGGPLPCTESATALAFPSLRIEPALVRSA